MTPLRRTHSCPTRYKQGVSLLPGLDFPADGAAFKPTATWRVSFDRERSVDPSPFETMALRLTAWFFLFAGVAYYFLIARRFEALAAVTQHVEVLLLIVMAQLALNFLYVRLSNRIHLGTGLRRLRSKVPDDDSVAVELEVIQDSVVTGYDEGFFWLDDGTLYFRGLQTVFRLNAEDVLHLPAWPRRLRPNLDAGRPPRWIVLKETPRPMKLRLRLIDPFEDRSARRRTAEFDRALTLWLHNRPAGSLETKIPPTALHPYLTEISPVRYEGLIASGVLTVLNICLLLTVRPSFDPSQIGSFANQLAALIALGLLVMSIRLMVRQWRVIQVRNQLNLESIRDI